MHTVSLMPGFVLAKAHNSACLWRAGADFDDPGEPRCDRHADCELLMQVSCCAPCHVVNNQLCNDADLLPSSPSLLMPHPSLSPPPLLPSSTLSLPPSLTRPFLSYSLPPSLTLSLTPSSTRLQTLPL
eukprot:2610887-Rhodomonas_salina.2